MNSAIPIEIRRAYEILINQGIIDEITEPLKINFEGDDNRWSFKCTIRIPFPNIKNLPELIELEVFIFENYPYSEVKCYSMSNGIQGFPHQDSETGKLCLKEEVLAPLDEYKLSTYVAWAKEWLIDAANNTLISQTDPYELPDFSRKLYKKTIPTFRNFLFKEDNQSFQIWKDLYSKFGLVKCNVPDQMSAFFVSEFYDFQNNLIYDTKFENTLFNHKNDIWGIWVVLENIYFHNFRPPQNFGEIRKLCNSQSIQFDYIQKKGWEKDNRSVEIGFILFGFPIPDYFFGEFKEIHWIPLLFFNIRHDRHKFSHVKKNNKIWQQAVKENFLDKHPLLWTKSYNIANKRLFSRGSLKKHIKDSNISIIGCGAIGSIIAENLIRGGVSNLVLFDSDIISQGNLCRHTLDGRDLGFSKASSLKVKLSTVNPLSNIKSFGTQLPLSTDQKDEINHLISSDIMIDCSTDNSAFYWLNSIAVDNKKRLVSIFFNFHADILILLISGEKTSCLDIYKDLNLLVSENKTKIDPKVYFYEPQKDEQILEGIGCWHPTFPALNIHINLLVSTAIDIIDNFLMSTKGLAAIVKRNKNNEYLINNSVIELAFYKDNYE